MSLLIFFALFGISAAECPDSWFSLGKYCYHISTARLDWGTSEEYCWNAGGYLAEFESLEDEKAVESVLNIDSDYWIGLSDFVHEGGYMEMARETQGAFLHKLGIWTTR